MSEFQSLPKPSGLDVQEARPHPKISPDMQRRIEQLPPEVQKMVIVLEPATTLYRHDRNATHIVETKTFALEGKAPRVIHFTDKPANSTNLTVNLSDELLLLDMRDEPFLDLLEQTYGSASNSYEAIGNDGIIGLGSFLYVPKDAREIVLLPKGMKAIGTIRPYEDTSKAEAAIREMLK